MAYFTAGMLTGVAVLSACFAAPSAADESLFGSSKLLATPGVIQAEGAGGAGLSTWAMISGYGSNR